MIKRNEIEKAIEWMVHFDLRDQFHFDKVLYIVNIITKELDCGLSLQNRTIRASTVICRK